MKVLGSQTILQSELAKDEPGLADKIHGLWKEGFHGVVVPLLPGLSFKIPVVTFSGVAILDVMFLVFYLITIGYTSWRGSWAYARSTSFAKKLQAATEELMKARKPRITED